MSSILKNLEIYGEMKVILKRNLIFLIRNDCDLLQKKKLIMREVQIFPKYDYVSMTLDPPSSPHVSKRKHLTDPLPPPFVLT